MIIKPNEIRNNEEIETEICIIGAGTAGLTIAREFIDTSKNIVILESGGEEAGSVTNESTEGKNIGIPYYDLKDTRERAFGGSSHLWYYVPGLRSRGMDAIDFEKKDWIPYSGWPISKTDLDPYYKRAHKLLNLGPYTYRCEDWINPDEINYLQNEDEDGFRTTMFQFARRDIFYNNYYNDFKIAENVKVFIESTVLNIETTENAKEVTHLTVSLQNEFQFTVKAKYFILAAGGLENARLLLLSNTHAKQGLGNDNDLVGRFFMEHPHIWGKGYAGTYYPNEHEKFNSNEIYNFHYRNGTPLLGYLIFKEEVIRQNQLLNITFDLRGESVQYPARYSEGIAAIQNVLSNMKYGRINKEMFRELGKFFNNGTAVAYERMRRLVNGKVKKWNRYELEETGIIIKLMAEQAPNPDSRVILGDEHDLFRQRKIHLDWRLTDLDLESMKKSMEILNTSLQKKGLGYIDVHLNTDLSDMAQKIHGGFHHMGTTRMHEDHTMGVVDKDCKMHGTHNLFVAGSSVFPTVGYANPTLTIAALAIRLADHLKKEKFAQNITRAI